MIHVLLPRVAIYFVKIWCSKVNVNLLNNVKCFLRLPISRCNDFLPSIYFQLNAPLILLWQGILFQIMHLVGLLCSEIDLLWLLFTFRCFVQYRGNSHIFCCEELLAWVLLRSLWSFYIPSAGYLVQGWRWVYHSLSATPSPPTVQIVYLVVWTELLYLQFTYSYSRLLWHLRTVIVAC